MNMHTHIYIFLAPRPYARRSKIVWPTRCTPSYFCTCARVCVCARLCVYIYILSYIDVCIYIYIHTHTHTYIHIHTYTYTCPAPRPYARRSRIAWPTRCAPSWSCLHCLPMVYWTRPARPWSFRSCMHRARGSQGCVCVFVYVCVCQRERERE